MAEREYSFEEVDRQIQSLDLSGAEKGVSAKGVAAASPANIIGQVCPIYRAIRPILQGLLSLPIPTAWKNAIRTFIRLMDLVCPT